MKPPKPETRVGRTHCQDDHSEGINHRGAAEIGRSDEEASSPWYDEAPSGARGFGQGRRVGSTYG
jgi:hypothetical protein